MKISAHLAKFQTYDKTWHHAIAITRNPGEADVLYMIDSSGEIVPLDKLLQYKLYPHYGSISMTHDV